MCLGLIIRLLACLQTKPDTSNNSAHKYSIAAAKYTGALADTFLIDVLLVLMYLPTLPTGKTSPALLD